MRRALPLLALLACAPDEPPPEAEPGSLAMRRLSAGQYLRTAEAAFGSSLDLLPRFEPALRRLGLDEVGATTASVTPSGLEGYEAMARSIASQAMRRPGGWSPCDDPETCPREALAVVMRRMWRRPVRPEDVDARVSIAEAGGLELALSTVVMAPEAIFRIEETGGHGALTDVSLASRLSYLLWDGPPDAQLLDLAERRLLSSEAVLVRQAKRMMASPSFETGVRALFNDLLHLDALDEADKDPELYGAWSQALREDAAEQTLRTIAQHLVLNDRAYSELFTTRQTQLDRALGVVYQVPVSSADGWEAHTFEADGPRAGILTHISILALHSQAARSSPTNRGRFVRESLLCETVPAPPANIDFSAVEQAGPDAPTARHRLAVHDRQPACASCHELMDPIGFGLEQFDAIGGFRTTELGAVIDTSGELDGVPFADAKGLGEAVAKHPSLAPCFVDHVYRYAVAREIEAGEAALVDWLATRFEDGGQSVRSLLLDLVRTDGFRKGGEPREVPLDPVP